MAKTLQALVGENVFELIGAVSGLLRQLESQAGLEEKPSEEYAAEVRGAESYEEVVRISYRFARRHLPSSLGIELGESPEEGEERFARIARGEEEE